MGICKFCGKEKALIKAHIIPKNFYLNYKEQGYKALNPDDGTWKLRQNGIYDNKNILCADCDGKILKKFDDEGYRILLSEIYNHVYDERNGDKIYHLEEMDFDYNLLRKFFISILWRGSISPERELYNINLGPYEEKAYEILTGEANFEHLFKILIFKAPRGAMFNHSVYIQPIKVLKNVNVYQIVMAGYNINIFLNSKKMSLQDYNFYNQMFMSKQHLYILESEMVDKDNQEYLFSYAKRWQKKVNASSLQNTLSL